ncbi:MAG TPA: hypothetical protein VFJ14_13415 [Nocardioidaceae bacterium]|nr:hypothetical protein [Nocardioidaceae bacterium]
MALGACVGAVVLAGCSSGDGSTPAAQKSTTRPPPSVATSTSTTFSPAQTAVIKAYTDFWKALAPASHAKTAAEQLTLLTPVTTDPGLSQLISGIASERDKGRAFYGVDQPHVSKVAITGGHADLVDCQDSSSAGVESMKTGKKLTVGVAAHPVRTTLLKRDGSWKVSTVSYPPAGTQC